MSAPYKCPLCPGHDVDRCPCPKTLGENRRNTFHACALCNCSPCACHLPRPALPPEFYEAMGRSIPNASTEHEAQLDALVDRAQIAEAARDALSVDWARAINERNRAEERAQLCEAQTRRKIREALVEAADEAKAQSAGNVPVGAERVPGLLFAIRVLDAMAASSFPSQGTPTAATTDGAAP